MKNNIQLALIVLLLASAGFGAAIYKNQMLGFSFIPEKKDTVWTIETKITFKADGGPVSVSLNLPSNSKELCAVSVSNISPGYESRIKNGRFTWKKDNAKGLQEIFYSTKVFRKNRSDSTTLAGPFKTVEPLFEGALKAAATNITKTTAPGLTTATESAVALLKKLTHNNGGEAALLMANAKDRGGAVYLARDLLLFSGIQAQVVKGLFIDSDRHNKKLDGYIVIMDRDNQVLLNPRTSTPEKLDIFLIWQQGDESLLEVTGGSGSEISFSTLAEIVPSRKSIIANAKREKAMLVDFSIYSLPVSAQNTFKLLLLIPIGAFIIVVLRNLVGITTTGTFMPVLIALVFLHTKLLPGVTLFVIVVSLGLVVRSYLSHLNLLLVPRISAVLVFVIIIYVAISVISIKTGFKQGLQVTFFPMIIISWTIERMSIIWEEEGPRDVFIQSGGTLFAATIICMAMENKYIGHLTYSFPELLLVVLAVIILIGSYSGFRLTELRRFEPMIRK
ncbi:MAG: UUP1 family membrane protein [Desulfobacterium sp.]|nr:UUP1 family membrane protein [Desulfobacterium sp.]